MICKDCGQAELVSFKVNMSRDGKSGIDFCRCPLCNREHRNIIRTADIFDTDSNVSSPQKRNFDKGKRFPPKYR